MGCEPRGQPCLYRSAGGPELARPPSEGETLLGEISGTRLESREGTYDEARDAYPGPDVGGQLGGEPSWIQGDETPTCDGCQQRMQLVAQLEEGHRDEPSANFGGGSAYAFACPACKTAKS